MINKYSSITGFTNGVAVNMAAIDKIVEREPEIVELKKYQPNSNIFKGGAEDGTEAWMVNTYTRKREIFGTAEAKGITEA